VVPSLREPLGLVALESLAAATPVVATRTGGLPEIVAHGSTGLLVPPRRPQQLAEAILQMANDPDSGRAMGQRGRAIVEKKFHPALLTRQVTQIYERVVGSSHDVAGRKAA
jgi:starch synthase